MYACIARSGLRAGAPLRRARLGRALAAPRGGALQRGQQRHVIRLHSRAEVAPGNNLAFTKQQQSGGMDERLYTYLLAHTREPQVLKELREETSTLRGANMQITPEEGQFLQVLTELMGVRKAVEIGVYTGYSSICFARGMADGGTIVCCEMDERPLELARKYWARAGVDAKVDLRVGPWDDGKETLDALLEGEGEGQYDLAFIDADKRGYDGYYEQCLRLVRTGGVILVDNVLWYGRVADPEESTKATLALKELNDKLLADERITLSIVPVGDGIAICRKR